MRIAEFDKVADEYYNLLSKGIAISGENPAYFAEYKIKDIAFELQAEETRPRSILDFGAGVGNSLPYFRKYFPDSNLTCADVSQRSLDVSKQRYPGMERYATIAGDQLPFANNSFDLIFSACVFHHIPQQEHAHWLKELNRVTAPNGALFIFEHNPLNPLTTFVVRSCPFDSNACLISARELALRVTGARWSNVKTSYRIFFPRMLKKLRGLESHLRRVPLGAQYYVSGRKEAQLSREAEDANGAS
jgi:ubiquinone/menaquinone biosynthesis C-methylase UbiE